MSDADLLAAIAGGLIGFAVFSFFISWWEGR